MKERCYNGTSDSSRPSPNSTLPNHPSKNYFHQISPTQFWFIIDIKMTHPSTPSTGQAEAAYLSSPKKSNSSPTKPFDGIFRECPSKLSNTAPINLLPESLPLYPLSKSSSKPSPTSVPVSPSKTARLEQTGKSHKHLLAMHSNTTKAECNKRVGWVLNLFSEGKLELAQTSAEMILANQKGLSLYHRAPLFAMLTLFPGGLKYADHAVRIYKYLSVKHPEFKQAYENAKRSQDLAHKIESLREYEVIKMKLVVLSTAEAYSLTLDAGNAEGLQRMISATSTSTDSTTASTRTCIKKATRDSSRTLSSQNLALHLSLPFHRMMLVIRQNLLKRNTLASRYPRHPRQLYSLVTRLQ